MEIPEILKDLERCTGVFPRRALHEAGLKQEEITPELLRILEDTLARAKEIAFDESERSYYAFLPAMFLLAQFRETQAYPHVARFARLPPETLDALAGDFITQGLEQVLASVCGGDTSLIETVIEDPKAQEYARGAGLEALLSLVAAGDKTREEVIRYMMSLFDDRLEREPSFVWSALVSAATDLYPDELYERIVQAYAEDLADPSFLPLEGVEEVLAQDRLTVIGRLPTNQPVYIQDAVEELEWWACFDKSPKPKSAVDRPRKRISTSLLFHKATRPPRRYPSIPDSFLRAPAPKRNPVAAPRRKVSPNVPCPCGSGRKYKKCCGRLS